MRERGDNPYQPPGAASGGPGVERSSRGRWWWRFQANLLRSCCVMLPWPLLAAAAGLHESDSDLFLYLGSVTIMLLLPVFLFAQPPEWVLQILMASVWLAVLVLPAIWAARASSESATSKSATSGRKLLVCHLLQSGFALLQAILGCLLIVGRGV